MKILYAFVACVLLLSCSDSDSAPQESLTLESVMGTWVASAEDGEDFLTNEVFAFRFNNDATQDYFAIVGDDNSSYLSYTQGSTISVEGDVIYIMSDIVDLEFDASVTTVDGVKTLKYTEIKNIQNGEDLCTNRSFTTINCADNYEEAIIALWEGTVIDGDDSEPFDDIRLEFKSGGTYDFYCKSDNGVSWTQLEQDNTYYILGNLLGTQWDESESVTAAEMWITEINGDEMTWRADRMGDDGEVFVAGFDLVKVEQKQ